jgi:molybdopterin molybdotransferase
MDLLNVVDIDEAQRQLNHCLEEIGERTSTVRVEDSLGMIIAEDIYAKENIPSYRRSTVDGYAVKASDLAVASEALPVFLTVGGAVAMGKMPTFSVSAGECGYVPTGGAVPDGADAMLMIEYTDKLGSEKISAFQAVGNGANIVKIGEDTAMDTMILKRGTEITPQAIGILCASGYTSVDVVSPIRMAVISTGDELVNPAETPKEAEIRDVNTYSITAQAEKNGYNVICRKVLPDDRALIEKTLSDLKDEADVVCLSGGSSKGEKDFTVAAIDAVAHPGTFIHGIAIKPGKPTILGFDKDSKTIFVGLPGHPVSAFIVFEALLNNLREKFIGKPLQKPYPARLTRNMASSAGRTTYIPVTLIRQAAGYLAEPVFGKSGLISTLSKAEGYFIMDKNSEGLSKDDLVFVHMI